MSRKTARLAKSFILARDFNGMRGTCNMLQIVGGDENLRDEFSDLAVLETKAWLKPAPPKTP
jgi:hypothetical protein